MRILFALAALPLLTTFAPASLFREPALPERIMLAALPLPLDPQNPTRRKIGQLTLLGAWSLRSNDPRFGGISTIHVEDGKVLALSDDGTRFEFPLPPRGPPGLTIERLPLGGAEGEKLDRDSESLAVDGRDAWVGFEASNSIMRYDRRGWRKEAFQRPRAMRRWPSNGGAEAMVRLEDDRFLVFSESRRRKDGATEALLFRSDPAEAAVPLAFGYKAPDGYKITDAALLPDGRLLLLNRRFSFFDGFSAKLTVAEVPRAAGAVIEGTEIASIAPPLTVDNLEGLSVTREGGRTILWIASDDNYTAVQRTLLMKFALDA